MMEPEPGRLAPPAPARAGGCLPARAAVERLWPSARGAVEAHYLRLSPADRRLRFHGATGDAAIAMHMERIDWRLGAVLGVWEEGRLVAVAELSRPTGRPRMAELALSVEDGARRRGLGALLMRAALAAARNRGARRVVLLWLPENRALAALAMKFGAKPSFADGAIEGVVKTGWPDFLSLTEEAAFDAGGLMRAALAFAAPRPGRAQAA